MTISNGFGKDGVEAPSEKNQFADVQKLKAFVADEICEI
jgi:hypothetical protein